MQLQQNAGGEDHPHMRPSTVMMQRTRSPPPVHRLVKHWAWPSQAYHCSFCTRVFRTAQALGGHMNIHRRERACTPNLVATTTSSRQTRPPPHLLLLPPPRPGLAVLPPPISRNLGYGKLNLVADPLPPRPISDSLTWLFSQLPPPGMQTPNMMRGNQLVKPYHRGLAVCKSPPGVRRHVCRIHTTAPVAARSVLYTGMMRSRSRGLEYNNILERISGGGVDHIVPAPEESALDLELRL